jgi:anthraniloyl-CoA monooxygenase
VTLTHAGRRGSSRLPEHGLDRPLANEGWETIAPSPIPYTQAHHAPRPMDESDFEALRLSFQEGAQNVLLAGYEILMIDAADGGLLASFISPLTNLRTDSWGGDIVGRSRVPAAVVEAVRSVWPGPLVMRLSASDWHPDGTTPADAVEAAKILAAVGVDAFEITAGGTVAEADPPFRRGHLINLSDEIRNRAGVATIVGGGLFTLDDVDTALAGGRADLCRLNPVTYRRNLWL